MNAKAHRKPGARFLPLLTRAQAEEKTALKQLADAQRHAENELNKLQELKQHSERTHTANMPQSPSALANRHAFMSRLSQAIRQQQRQLQQVDQSVEHARQHWLACNQNTLRYQRLIDNELQRAKVRAARHEQKELDEIALRRRRHSSNMVGG